MLTLPIYRRNGVYYLHCRVAGRQVKRSLRTSDRHIAVARGARLLSELRIAKYRLDLKNGIAEAADADDHARLLEAIDAMKSIVLPSGVTVTDLPTVVVDERPAAGGLKVGELVEQLFRLKTHLKQATAIAYRNTAAEFATFTRDLDVQRVERSDVTRYQNWLSGRGNSARTIDNKIGNLRALFAFAIKQSYRRGENPCSGLALQTKRQRTKNGYAVFEPPEVRAVFGSDAFARERQRDPDFYYACLLGLACGLRIGEITALTRDQVQQFGDVRYVRVREGKTEAAQRDVPLLGRLWGELGLGEFVESKRGAVFKYRSRDGRGAGNAAGKKFARLLAECGVTRDKLVFHSLRKYCNDRLLKCGVSLEIRCQMLGHEVDNINVSHYTTSMSVAALAQAVECVQGEILDNVTVTKLG